MHPVAIFEEDPSIDRWKLTPLALSERASRTLLPISHTAATMWPNQFNEGNMKNHGLSASRVLCGLGGGLLLSSRWPAWPQAQTQAHRPRRSRGHRPLQPGGPLAVGGGATAVLRWWLFRSSFGGLHRDYFLLKLEGLLRVPRRHRWREHMGEDGDILCTLGFFNILRMVLQLKRWGLLVGGPPSRVGVYKLVPYTDVQKIL